MLKNRIKKICDEDELMEIDDLDALKSLFSLEPSVDYNTREIILDGMIDDSALHKFIMPIIKINKEDDINELPRDERIPITLYINCLGGDPSNGFALIDVIRSSKTPVRGVVLGFAYSMAVPILLSCHEKLCYPHGSLLIHDGICGIQNSTGKFVDQYKYIMKQDKYFQDFIVENSKISRKLLNKNIRNEWYLTAEESLQLGLIDKIITEIV